MSADFPTDAEARDITDYVQAHSFDDAQCAECGTVRWEHAAHFLDFLAPLIRAREAAAWDAGARAAWERSTPEVNGLHYHWRTSGEPLNPYTRQEADDARD